MTLADLRQSRYPKEFRIAAPAWSNDALASIDRLVEALKNVPPPHVDGGDTHIAGLMADLGTGLWRIGNKVADPPTGEPAPEMRSIARHLESTLDALTQAGVEIKDRTGEFTTGGEAMKVLAYQPTKGITREQVIETVKPTIYFRGKMIQAGEVIVGVPDNPQ